MTGEQTVNNVKNVFSKETLIHAGKVLVGAAISEGINYGMDYAARQLTSGKTKKVPHEIGGLVVAVGGAVIKQPSVACGGLVDSGVNLVRDLTGFDITKPAQGAEKIADRTLSEDVI
ncbi:MAG: hypothetical protein PHH85_03560 [Candidatus Methanoperedens sp.]|nr:hypothetical protein [Candidatus Methanoperedens sp.]